MRIRNWEIALAHHLSEVRKLPFVWGSNDCCLFAANAAQVITGMDFAACFRGYGDEAGALESLQRNGVSTVEEAASLVLGPPMDKIRFAKRGDVVSIRNGQDQLSLGIMDLSGREACLVSRTRGFILVPLRLVNQAWSI